MAASVGSHQRDSARASARAALQEDNGREGGTRLRRSARGNRRSEARN